MISNVWDLRDQIYEGLELEAELVETEGEEIDVGEEFDVKFSVTHALSDPRPGRAQGTVRFLDCKLILRGTRHAVPVEGDELALELGDLGAAGERAERTVSFRALQSLPRGPWGGDPEEAYVELRLVARFDWQAFLDFSKDETFWTQIEAG